MACNSCAKSFSLLRKEKGCPGCGFSYCSKCLDNKVFLPKLNAEAKVCSKCKRAATTPADVSNTIPPPDAYYKRLVALENSTINTGTYDPKDLHILERLQKLKEDKMASTSATSEEEIRKRLQNIKGETPSTTDAELQARLAKLRGVPIEVLTSKPGLPPPDTRSEQEQIEDLMKQYIAQTIIDSTYKDEFDARITEMESRMQKLKGTEAGTSNNEENVESEDEEEAVKKIVQKIKAEAVVDDIAPCTNDELPFCEICNEDASLRCLGCRYLFCKQCFLEHKDDDDGCDKYEPYEPPKGLKHD